MNEHWDSFVSHVSWFVGDRRTEVSAFRDPGSWKSGSVGFDSSFPTLSRLLQAAYITDVVIGEHPYVLFSWPSNDGIRGWLGEMPVSQIATDVFHQHRLLLESFGGIVERSNEPSVSWLLNNNEVLTASEALHDATFIEDYAWAFEEIEGGIPLKLTDYYSIAREANGNNTLCHRSSGEVVLFAPDHSFKHVKPLEGCPKYTLYRVDGAPTFETWVEAVANQMLASCAT